MDRLRGLCERLARLPASPAIDERIFARRELERRLRALERRLREGPDAPLGVAVFGPTGAGKSKLFNSLLGREASPSGYRRPFTRRSVRAEAWPGCWLIDSTDFDSVEAENREEAEAVFEDADAFVFVAEAQKYADRATWEYLRRIYERGGPLALVLNKVTSDAEGKDFARRLEAAFGAAARAAELLAIPELPIDDRTLLPPGDLAVRAVLGAVRRLFDDVPARRALRARRLARDFEAALGIWEAGRAKLAAYAEGLDRLSERLDVRFRSALADLESRLRTDLDPGLKAELYARLLERMEKIDVLRYPRKLLALPFLGLRKLAGRWLPPRRRSPARGAGGPRPGSFEGLEFIALRASEESVEDFASEARCPRLLDAGGTTGLRPPPEDLRALSADREARFRAWLEREALATASQLTAEHKLKFILSQVLYNAMIIGVQIHTAGGFTLAEALTDAVVSPLVAKAAGIAVSSDAVARFAARARAEHLRLLGEVLEDCRLRFRRHLELAGSFRSELDGLAEEMARLAEEKDRIVAEFEAGGLRGGAHGA